MAKRGRKPKTERKGYFYEEQEEAVKKYLEAQDQDERNEVFNTVLKPAFTKMIESIIRRYKLYVPEEEFKETFDDTLSFLSSKMANFDPSKHHKAYSYYGTICKNYLIYKINQFKKKIERNEQYDDVYERFQNNIDYSQPDMEGTTSLAEDLVKNTVKKIHSMIDDENEGLTDNEKKVGLAMCELFENWEDILCTDGSNKLQKSSVLYFLREETMMSTKELRDNMKKFRDVYYILKKDMIE
jgi:hypothetical protein